MMQGFIRYINQVIFLMGGNSKKIFQLSLLFLLSAFLDIVGLSVIGPFLVLVTNQSEVKNDFMNHWLEKFGATSSTNEALLMISIFLMGIFFLKMIASICVNWEILTLSRKCREDLQAKLMRAYQSQPYIKFIQRNSSEYTKSIHDATGQFVSSIQGLLKIFSEIFISIFVLFYLAITNALILSFLVFVFAVFSYIYIHTFRRKLENYGKLSTQAVQQTIQSINEGMFGFKEIRILNKEHYFFERMNNATSSFSTNWTKGSMISMIPRYFIEFTLVFFVTFFVILTILLGLNVDTVIPTIGVFVFASMRLLPAANLLLGGSSKLSYNRYAISTLFKELRDTERYRNVAEVDSLRDFNETKEFERLILRDVCFKYSSQSPWSLEGISLSINKGDSIGIIGVSGGGKTTLIDVILGLLEPQKGEVIYNDIALQNVIKAFNAQTAYLPQEIFIIDDTLQANITLGVADNLVDHFMLKSAIIQSQLTNLIDSLPDGLHTRLGERGINLSGGQRQRVALARAFYFQRNLLVLDEATSAMDAKTEFQIIEEIQRLKGNKTIIVVAHRLSTLQHCDRIYRLERGRIVSVGTYKELIGGF